MPEAALSRRSARESAPDGGSEAVSVLTLTGVTKSWSSQAAPVLADVDLSLPPGTTTAISGRNGAGKTTLLRIAAGLIGADSGSVTIAGLDVERDRTDFQRRVGFLAAGNSGLYARLKVEHHLDMWSRLALMPRGSRREAVERAVDTFELGSLCGRRVDRLSMGQRQRLRLALAFVHGPTVALLDEPATSLDEEGIALLDRALDALKASGGAAIVCLPSGWEQALSVDRPLILADGSLEQA